jgi:hypothetical protein
LAYSSLSFPTQSSRNRERCVIAQRLHVEVTSHVPNKKSTISEEFLNAGSKHVRARTRISIRIGSAQSPAEFRERLNKQENANDQGDKRKRKDQQWRQR